jgi:hypothetical protein
MGSATIAGDLCCSIDSFGYQVTGLSRDLEKTDPDIVLNNPPTKLPGFFFDCLYSVETCLCLIQGAVTLCGKVESVRGVRGVFGIEGTIEEGVISISDPSWLKTLREGMRCEDRLRSG